MTDILTPGHVISLAQIIEAVNNGSTVRRLIDETVYTGTVRSFTADADGNPGAMGRDVRDVFVRVTLHSGMDTYWPVRELADDVHNRTAAFERR